MEDATTISLHRLVKSKLAEKKTSEETWDLFFDRVMDLKLAGNYVKE